MNNIEIFIVMHKEFDLKKLSLESIYKKLMVGKAKNDFKVEDNSIIFDSTGENIYKKNKNYCELTGLYWIWKNVDTKYVGLCHYRRYFFYNNKIITKKSVQSVLDRYDIIVSMPWCTRENIHDTYEKKHIISDLNACRNIIEKKYPDYLNAYDSVMNSHKLYPYNMFISKKELIDDYCEWLFSIFDILEKNVNIDDRDLYQARIYGFLSERLFNVWIKKHNLKVYECSVINTDKSLFKNVKNIISSHLKTKIYR